MTFSFQRAEVAQNDVEGCLAHAANMLKCPALNANAACVWSKQMSGFQPFAFPVTMSIKAPGQEKLGAVGN